MCINLREVFNSDPCRRFRTRRYVKFVVVTAIFNNSKQKEQTKLRFRVSHMNEKTHTNFQIIRVMLWEKMPYSVRLAESQRIIYLCSLIRAFIYGLFVHFSLKLHCSSCES